ncbi:MAG: hypothetical protein ACKPEQ_39290, partial [Dolichospermum sp.]
QNDLSYSINTKTDLPEVIKIQDDAIIVSKKTVISSMIDCKIIQGTDNYQLEPITDEIIENDENYEQAWVLTRINNNIKLVEIEVCLFTSIIT